MDYIRPLTAEPERLNQTIDQRQPDYYMRLLFSGGKATFSAGDLLSEGRRAAARCLQTGSEFQADAGLLVDELRQRRVGR